MKGIFIYVPLGGRQDDADGLGKCFGRFSLKIWFIAHLRHDAADAFFCVPADGWAVLAVRETVDGETPAAAAISLIVTAML